MIYFKLESVRERGLSIKNVCIFATFLFTTDFFEYKLLILRTSQISNSCSINLSTDHLIARDTVNTYSQVEFSVGIFYSSISRRSLH